MIRDTGQAIPDPTERGTGTVLRQRAGHASPVPVLTAMALTATLLGTITRLFTPGVFDALRRNPTELGHGQIWRLLSPVLVQGDHSVLAIIGVFVLCGVIGYWGERLLPRTELAILDTGLRDIHGAPFLVGLAVGSAFELQKTRRRQTEPPAPNSQRQSH